ncbi:scavenger receptor cysteine-rich domain-containing group B protein-like isoform X1 [Aphelocoma coerulescens]|uniref:scavenger receptor cysteine-rich domain-containing group B protein-like isoform X1 n=1 Tax=Aphelocoma coerulescens TaxID=39617 RepID=UPI003604D959
MRIWGPLSLRAHLGLLLHLWLCGPGEAGPAPLRLAGGPHRCAGRVEVFHAGRWGTVCDDSWDVAAAEVTCRQVRCGPALALPGTGEFGTGEGPIWLDDVTCTGREEALELCRARPWGEHNCHHGEDAGVACAGADPPVQPQVLPQGDAQVDARVDDEVDAQVQLKVRLVNGSSRCAGRVEVLHLGRWGTVCDDTWDLAAARVTCRQLGCGTAVSAPGSARFGPGTDPIWLDGTHCTGEELTLAQCQLHPWGEHNCGHSEDASAVCTGADPPQVRLRGGPGPCAGQVQVLHNRSWHQVCGQRWGLPEAQVVCRQVGCGPALSAPVGPQPVPAGGPWLAGLSCRGSEELLLECRRIEAGACASGAAAAIACAEPPGVPDSCSVLEALLGVGAGLCGALLGLYLCARCAPPRRGRRHKGEPLIPEPEEPPSAAEP